MHNHADRCMAFNKKDKKQCRLYKRPNQKTCYIHRNYYKNWLEARWKNILQKSFNGISKRELEEWTFQLNHRAIKIPVEYVQTLNFFDENFIYNYDFLIRYTDISPMENVYGFLQCIKYRLSYLDLSTFDVGLEPYMKDWSCCLFIFAILIENILARSNGSTASFLLKMLQCCRSDSWKQLLYSTKFKYLFHEYGNELQRYLGIVYYDFIATDVMSLEKNPIECLIKNFNMRHSYDIQRRCLVYKQELIAAFWKPSRIQKWLDNGLDIDCIECL
jgi:hypothetical protein